MGDVLHGVRLTLAYDGTGLCGWQKQPGKRSVQSELDEALAQIGGIQSEVRGASRTDAGVHAAGQVAAFDARRRLDPERWVQALNRYLPDQIAVQRAEPCPAGYAPRFDAVSKTYRYLLWAARARNPLWRGQAWHPERLLPRAGLDVGAMRQAAARVRGTHDFRAFQAADDARQNTVRTLNSVQVEEGVWGEPNLVAIEVCGTAFLKQMVRILAGTLVEAGRGRLKPAQVARLLGAQGDRQRAGHTAPAHGLTLLRVELGRNRNRVAPAIVERGG